MKADNAAAIMSGEKTFADFYVHGMNGDEFEKVFNSDMETNLEMARMHRTWVKSVLRMKTGKNAVVVNGKVILIMFRSIFFYPCRRDVAMVLFVQIDRWLWYYIRRSLFRPYFFMNLILLQPSTIKRATTDSMSHSQ